MALTSTTLDGAISANATYIRLTSGTGAAVGSFIKVDSEYMRILDITNSPTLWVQRGQLGSAAVAHSTLAAAVIGVASDFPTVPAPRVYTYGADSAIAVAPGYHQLCKGSAGAYTLANPSTAQDGDILVIPSLTSYAHVITGVSIWDGTATVNTTLTYAAVQGASCTLGASRGVWEVISLNAVTPAP